MHIFGGALVFCVLAVALGNDNWRDTDITTRVWKHISDGDLQGLQAVVYDHPDSLSARSGDGRGALFWAYEYRQSEIVAYLENAGVDTTLRDADGKRPSELVNGVGETAFMKRVKEQKADEAERSWKRYQEAQVVPPDDLDEEDDEDWEDGAFNDEDEGDILDEDYNDEL